MPVGFHLLSKDCRRRTGRGPTERPIALTVTSSFVRAYANRSRHVQGDL